MRRIVPSLLLAALCSSAAAAAFAQAAKAPTEPAKAAPPGAADAPSAQPGAIDAEAPGPKPPTNAPEPVSADARQAETRPSAAPLAAAAENASAMRAYQAGLEKLRLAATAPLSQARLRDELAMAEQKLLDGRRDEAIGDLTYIIESPRFQPFAASEDGQLLVVLLGDALGRAGAEQAARNYLTRVLKGNPNGAPYRRAVRSLVELGLASERPDTFVADLANVPAAAPEELRSDVSYLRGRAAERRKNIDVALAEYAKVSELSRFWAQATYLSGLIQVERGRLRDGERLFCKVADPKQTPRRAPLFGGSDFFEVRDLARLGLGRVAHEQYRFDDARYYYYLVPKDSAHVPEALYESATSRYEAKDYDGARELLAELKSLDVHHSYEDEAYILEAYLDLATCRFPAADAKLRAFISRYEPLRNAARRVSQDAGALRSLLDSVRLGTVPVSARLGVDPNTAGTLGALIRLDAGYGRAESRLTALDHQLSALRGTITELSEASRRLVTPKALRPQSGPSELTTAADKLARIEAQLGEVRRLVRELERTGRAGDTIVDVRRQLELLELKARAARASVPGTSDAAVAGQELPALVEADKVRAERLYHDGQRTRAQVLAQQSALAKQALQRLERRLSRLLARARLGRIETVLGKKRALEVEIEALSQGLLPRSIVDSLDAARYLQDDEEYWPYDGEDWTDEYVGGEGLR